MLKLRRIGMALGLCLGSVGLATVTVQAEIERGLLDVGRSMLDLPEQWLGAKPRTIIVNGTRVHILSGRSDLSMTSFLDHVQARCREHDGGLSALALRARRALPKEKLGTLDGVLRAENGKEGVVACLQLGTDAMTSQQLIDRLERFSDRLDLNDLGGVRMVRVSPREYGSFFVIAMSEGSASLRTMFPESGDAPGMDFSLMARPRNARRLLSAWQVDGEPAINAYRIAGGVDDVWAEQLSKLSQQGWEVLDAQSAQSSEQHASLFWRAGKTALVVAQPDDKNTLLSILPLDGGPGAISVD